MSRFAILALSLLAPAALAQVEATVNGQVIDAATGEPVPFASITTTDRDGGAVVTGVLADEDGHFVISGLPEGSYTVAASSAGHSPAESELVIGGLNTVYDLGTIALLASGQPADQIVVVGQQVEGVSIDRRVYSMDDNIVGAAGSLLDAMRGLPGLTVDQEGRVLLRGSDRVAILIDGQYSSLAGFGNQSGLDSVPAANIDRIEIINNPSAAYDAAGMAGVINIIYREDVEAGLNLEAGLTLGVGSLSKRKEDLPTALGSFTNNEKVQPTINLTHNNADRRFFLLADMLWQEDLPNNEFHTRYYDDGSVTLSQVPENREQYHYVINGGLERFFDNGRTFGFESIIDFESHKDVAQVPFYDQATMTLNRFWFWHENEDTGHVEVNLDFTREYDDVGRELTMRLQYIRGWEDEAYHLNEVSPVRVGTDMTHVDAEENTLPFTLDYTKPLRNGRLETGARAQRRWHPVTYTVVPGQGSIIYPGLGDWSDWSEEILASYVNLVREGQRYGLEAGFRLEQTDVAYQFAPENIYYPENDAYDYFEVYPSVGITYDLNDRSAFAAHFNRRVDRPGEPELRIFPKYDDPENLKVGNPYLRPQFTETIELSYEHAWGSGSAILSAYTRDIEDPYTRVYAIDPTNPNYDIINKIYQNVGSGSEDGVELILSRDVSSRWEVTSSINWYEKTIDADVVTLLFPIERPFVVEYSQEDTWDVTMNNLVRFARGIELQVSLSYYGERNIAQGMQAARSSVDIGLAMPVMQEQGELSITVTDLFNDLGLKHTIDGDGFDAVYENFYETQVISVGLKRTF